MPSCLLRLAASALVAAALIAPALGQGKPLSLDPKGTPPAQTPPRPGASPVAPTPQPAAQPAGQSAPNAPKPTVERVNAYFNGISGLIADFVQTGPDGRRYDGKLYILRPGKMKFEYRPPSPLEIISDGRTVAVRDRKLNTQDLYLVGQTPLKFLLQERIDVARDSKVISLQQQGESAVLVIEDKATVGGTSRIRLVFNNADMTLKQWTVTDPQGYDTLVQLANIDQSRRPDAKMFFIQEGRIETPR